MEVAVRAGKSSTRGDNMIELKRGSEVTFFKVTVNTKKGTSIVTKEYLVDEYEAPNANFAIAFVMEKISSLTEVTNVSVRKFENKF